MKSRLILAGLACGLVGALTGCDGAAESRSTTPTEGTSLSGRVTITQGAVKVSDSNGDTLVKDTVRGGGFDVHIPGGAHFPLLVDIDSAGIHLISLVPGGDSARFHVEVTPLTDSAARSLLGPGHGPRPLGPKEWKDKLDSLRPVVPDTLRLPPHPRDSLRPPPPPKDTLKHDTLRPPPPPKDTLLPKPPKDTLKHDTLRPPPPPRDTLKLDTLHLPPLPKDSLPPPPPKDTLGGRLSALPALVPSSKL